MAEATALNTAPVSRPYVSEYVNEAVQLPDKVFGMFKQSERKPMNRKGYQFSILVRSNPNIGGGMNSGDTMLAGAGDDYIQLCIGATVSNGARAKDGGNLREEMDAQYFGLTPTQQDVLDASRFATEQDKNVCFGGLTFSRGVITVIPTYSAPYSTVTFDAAQGGSYYLNEMEGRSFLVHDPTSFSAHGGTTPFVLYDIPTPTTARFIGDMTGGTAIAANDILVPTGTATGHSSVNKGIRNLMYMAGIATGDYFTASRDTQPKIRPIVKDLTGNEVTRAVLEFMDGLFTFKWPAIPEGTKNHVDLFSPSQRIKMLFQAEGPMRINTTDGGGINYSPKTEFRGWGQRRHEMDVYIPDSTWFIFLMTKGYRYVQKEFGPWNYDGQDWRAIPDTGSIRDAVQKHWIAVDAVGHEDCGKNLTMINCSTSGSTIKSST